MKKLFVFELIVGIIMLVAVSMFGTKGIAALALLSLVVFVRPKKMDEREWLLFYRVGNFTAGASLLVAFIISSFSDVAINGIPIGQNWFGLLLAAFIGVHGAIGLILFREEGKGNGISNY